MPGQISSQAFLAAKEIWAWETKMHWVTKKTVFMYSKELSNNKLGLSSHLPYTLFLSPLALNGSRSFSIHQTKAHNTAWGRRISLMQIGRRLMWAPFIKAYRLSSLVYCLSANSSSKASGGNYISDALKLWICALLIYWGALTQQGAAAHAECHGECTTPVNIVMRVHSDTFRYIACVCVCARRILIMITTHKRGQRQSLGVCGGGGGGGNMT